MYKQIEANVKRSFARVRQDMHSLRKELQEQKNAMVTMHKNQEMLLKKIEKLELMVQVPKPEEKFIGAKSSMKLHDVNCPYAKQIDPENKVVFHTKDAAFSLGYSACTCLKNN